MRWDDVNARARGLATHLLPPADLARAAQAEGWSDFVACLRERGYPFPAEHLPDGPDEFDEAVGTVTARRYALLSRWLGPRRSVLAVIYEVEERQALRALLRGAVQGISPAGRLHAVTPTPGLPKPVLQHLAQASSPADLAERLLEAGHPAGRALATAVESPVPPGLLGLEQALARTYAARATRAARRAGRVMRSFVSGSIDLENAWALLEAGSLGADVNPDDLFLPGGRAISLERFRLLAARGEVSTIRDGLHESLAGSAYAEVFVADAEPGNWPRRALAGEIAWCRAMARLQPLGVSVALEVLCRIRAEAADLRYLAWGRALAMPPRALAASLAASP